MREQQQNNANELDDMIVFSESMSLANNNYKSLQYYRKVHDSNLKKLQIQTSPSYKNVKDKQFISVIDTSEIKKQHHSNQKIKNNFDNLSLRRNSTTTSNSRKIGQQTIRKKSHTIHLTHNLKREMPFDNLQPKQNKYVKMEKAFNKGVIKQKYLICWLNSILMEACCQQKFDLTIDNPAIKKYGLDENSLRSKGLKPQNLNRVYKSLFVYSIGFNNLLRDICDKNMNLRKTIWKVFAILLQYCASGTFQMMIAQIERDKIKKIQTLTKQIRDRQKIIQDNAQINQIKNAKIFKQMRKLRQQNQNLNNQKQTLAQEFKLAQQAFNSQVTLRLRFQNRINQIHGVHTQMKNKHQRLKQDYNDMVSQLASHKSEIYYQKKTIIDLTIKNDQKSLQISQLKKQLVLKDQQIIQMQVKKNGDANLFIENINNIKNLKTMLQQKKRQIKQLNIILQNSKILFTTQKNEHKQTSISLKDSLQQNIKLHSTIQNQMKDLNSLLYDKLNFNIATSTIQAQSICIKQKLNDKIKQIKVLQHQIKQNIQFKRKFIIQLQVQKKLRERAQEDLKICYDNIKEMKNAKNLLEQESQQKIRRIQTIDSIINEKDNQISQQKQKLKKLSDRAFLNSQTIRDLQSKINVLNDKLRSNEEISSKKISLLITEKQQIENTCNQLSNIKIALQLQKDKLQIRLDDTEMNLKNEKFERFNLNIFYKNALNTGQQKSEQIKKLDIKLSMMNQQLNNSNIKLQNYQYIYNQKIKQYQKQIKIIKHQYQLLFKNTSGKKQYIHPMIYQDIIQQLRITKNRNKYNEIRFSQQRQKFIKQLLNWQHKLKQQQTIHKNSMLQLTKNCQQQVNKKQTQMLYQISKFNHLSQQKKVLQYNILKSSTINQLDIQKIQTKYLNTIQEQKQQISFLVKELNKVSQMNRNMIDNYKKNQQKLTERQKCIQELKSNLQQQKKQKKCIEQLQRDQQKNQKNIKNIRNSKNFINQENNQVQLNHSFKQKTKQKIHVSLGKRDNIQSQLKKQQIAPQSYRRDGSYDDSKRADFIRKYKGAYIYYQK